MFTMCYSTAIQRRRNFYPRNFFFDSSCSPVMLQSNSGNWGQLGFSLFFIYSNVLPSNVREESIEICQKSTSDKTGIFAIIFASFSYTLPYTTFKKMKLKSSKSAQHKLINRSELIYKNQENLSLENVQESPRDTSTITGREKKWCASQWVEAELNSGRAIYTLYHARIIFNLDINAEFSSWFDERTVTQIDQLTYRWCQFQYVLIVIYFALRCNNMHVENL